MIVLTVAFACLAVGLYAGKRRAGGLGWYEIACEMVKGFIDVIAKVWGFVSWPFRKEKKGDAGEGQNVA